MCNEKQILYDKRWQPTQRLGWEELQSTFQSQTYTQKGHGHFWWSTTGLFHYSFLNLSKTTISEKYPQQINEMHWKLHHQQLALVNRKGPILLHDNAQQHIEQPMLQKLNKLGYEVLPHLP